MVDNYFDNLRCILRNQEILTYFSIIREKQEGAGDLLGETAVMTGQPRNATVSAGAEGATLTRISREQFVEILGSNNAIAQSLREMKKDSFAKTERRRNSGNAHM